jgi:5-methylcytosine-specific restriction endonuclease McrA
MSLNDEYFELCYTKRIHEFSKIDLYKKWTQGEARKKYQSLDSFYRDELKIDKAQLNDLRSNFKTFNDLYSKYYNEQRKELFNNSEEFLKWYKEQNDCCNYCEITQSELYKIVATRNGNLTLNQKTKRSKGTLEIEKLNPSNAYTYENSVLSCPLCNNAKSNLISEDDWRKFFAPAMKKYINSILTDDNR